MKLKPKDRHLFGAGAAACAICCTAPLLTVLGIAGATATIATLVFAGLVFGLVVGMGAVLAVVAQRRRNRNACAPTTEGPVDVELTAPSTRLTECPRPRTAVGAS